MNDSTRHRRRPGSADGPVSGRAPCPARAVAMLVGIVVLALAGGASRAESATCDTSICAGDPCTITGTHNLTPDCVLDFGAKNVTVGATTQIEGAPSSTFTIRAGTLTVRGTVRAMTGGVSLETTGALSTTSGSLARVIGNGDFGGVNLVAGGAVTLNGTEITANGDLGSIFIQGTSVTVDGPVLEANGGSLGGGSINVNATVGNTTIASAVRAFGTTPGEEGGSIAIGAAGTLVVSAPLNVTGGSDASAGSIYLESVGDLSVGNSLLAYGGGGVQGDGGEVSLRSAGDITLDGPIDARGVGLGASGGQVTVGTSATARITILRPIDVGTISFAGSSGSIQIATGCDVVIANALRAAGSGDGGTVSIHYRRSLDVTGATIQADPAGGNEIVCGCVDQDQNGTCDGGCFAQPVGTGSATITPPATPIPDALGSCAGCGDGIIDVFLGEQCDDGNLLGGDCCSAVCSAEANGSSCDDGIVCTNFDSCQAVVCVGSPAPAPVCTAPTSSGTSTLTLKRGSQPSTNTLNWKWKPGAVLVGDLGDPTAATDYRLCVYGNPGGVPTLFTSLSMPAGGQCAGKACWKSKGSRGFSYADRDRTPDGVKSASLRASTTGRGSIDVKAGGASLPMPTLPLGTGTEPVTVQLRAESGACYGATYSTATKSTDRLFKAKAD